MTIKKLYPMEQGNLDALCGVYALVNVLRLVRPGIDDKTAQKLVREILEILEPRQSVISAVCVGVELAELSFLLRTHIADRYQLVHKTPFCCRQNISLDEFWCVIQEFILQEKGAAIVGLGGVHDHWTVVRAVTPKSLMLFDSSGLKRIARRASETVPGACYHIEPSCLFLIKEMCGGSGYEIC